MASALRAARRAPVSFVALFRFVFFFFVNRWSHFTFYRENVSGFSEAARRWRDRCRPEAAATTTATTTTTTTTTPAATSTTIETKETADELRRKKKATDGGQRRQETRRIANGRRGFTGFFFYRVY